MIEFEEQLRQQSAALLRAAFDAINKPEKAKNVIRKTKTLANQTNDLLTKIEKEKAWDNSVNIKVVKGGYSGTETPTIDAEFILRLFRLYPRDDLENNICRLSTFVRAIPVGLMRRGTIDGLTIIAVNIFAISTLLLATPVDPILSLLKRVFKVETDGFMSASVCHTIGAVFGDIRKKWDTLIESNNELKDKLKVLSAENNEFMASIFSTFWRRPFSGHYGVLARIVYGLEGNVKSDTNKLTPFVLAVLGDLSQGFKKEKDEQRRHSRYDEFFKRLVYFYVYCDPLDAKRIYLGRLAESAYKVCVPEDLYSRFSVDRKKAGTHMSIADFYLLASHYQTIVKAESVKEQPDYTYVGRDPRYKFSLRTTFSTMSLFERYETVHEPKEEQLRFFADHGYPTIYDRIMNDREELAKESKSFAQRAENRRVINGKEIILKFKGGAAKTKKPASSAASAAAKKKKPASAVAKN